ncbi:MAG: DUF1003 domain-containing protein [Bacillota bacterium]
MVDKKLDEILINDEEEREEKLHELIRGRKSLNINTELSSKLTLGQKAADSMARFAGSWMFLIVFAVIVLSWTLLNTRLMLARPFDPYPYVFLNLILACISSIQAPIIMMSQNRESQKDRLKAENDYLINLKSEIILEDLHMKIDDIIKTQKKLKKELYDIKISISKLNSRFDNEEAEIILRSGADGEKGHRNKHTGGKEQGLHN